MPTTIESDRQVKSLEQFVAEGIHRGATYGMEWGDPDAAPLLAHVKNEFLLPSLARGITAVEIGCEGGRWSRYFSGRVKKAYLVDATPSAEIAIRAGCRCDGFEFIVANGGDLSAIATQSVDYAFSFDTFVHFHRELFDQYVVELSRLLRPGGILHLHHAARWPETIANEQVFQYRDDMDVEALVASASFRPTGRIMEFRVGFGSVLREAVRLRTSATELALPTSS